MKINNIISIENNNTVKLEYCLLRTRLRNFVKPGAQRPARAWFLKIAFVHVDVGMCVYAPRAIKIYSREMKLE